MYLAAATACKHIIERNALEIKENKGGNSKMRKYRTPEEKQKRFETVSSYIATIIASIATSLITCYLMNI